jgi:ABC-2 type transport system permease protein
MPSALAGPLAILRRDAQVFFSYRARLPSYVLAGFFAIALFHFISKLVRVEPFNDPEHYFAFVVIGMLAYRILAVVVASPAGTMRQELVEGTFDRLAVSATGPTVGLASLLLFPALLALALGALDLVLASLVFGLDLRWPDALLALPLGLLTALACAPLGLAILALNVVFKQAAGGTNILLSLISLLAGFYFPPELLPAWLEWMSEVQPFTPAVDLLRTVLVGGPVTSPTGESLAKLVGFTAVSLPLAVHLLRAAVAHVRRKGTLLEY